MGIDEEIALLRGQPIPGAEGYTFAEDLEHDSGGEGGRLDVVNADGVSVGTAAGLDRDQVVAAAQKLASEDDE